MTRPPRRPASRPRGRPISHQPSPAFAARLRDAMAWAQVRPATLADLVSVHRVTVSKWRTGETPDDVNLAKLARVLDVNRGWLATGRGSMHDADAGPAQRGEVAPGADPAVVGLTGGIKIEPQQRLLGAILEVAQADQRGTALPVTRLIALLEQVFAAGVEAGGGPPARRP